MLIKNKHEGGFYEEAVPHRSVMQINIIAVLASSFTKDVTIKLSRTNV